MKRLASSLWMLATAVAGAALPPDPGVSGLAPVARLESAGVLGADGLARAVNVALPSAGEAVHVDRDEAFGAVAKAVGVLDKVSVAGVLALGGAALTVGEVTAVQVAGLVDPTVGKASVFGLLSEGLRVADVSGAYARLASVVAVATDPLGVPIDLWVGGPLGELRKQANVAAARGDKAAFQELSGRYWALFNAAVERRRVFGGGAGGRKWQP